MPAISSNGLGSLQLNDNGTIAGNYLDSSSNTHSFVYDSGILTFLNAPGATNTNAYGINTHGQIAGYYTDAGGIAHGFTATPVPIPAAVWLFGSALAGLGVFGRQLGQKAR